ncbi:hypothetical protein B0A52_09355 [Exophiala mesophila]|uniref:Glutathione S-transferase kappa n=1 Tax=Exophiala mesophila TaxID=212818 RepID=A0A438MSF8_EXOME|nr:hypothetical protein B0A52_09355 [Exophiala mesophila]
MAAPLEIDVYYSFRSPYCYLAIHRLADMQRKYHVQIHLRPVKPLLLRGPDWFRTTNPLHFPYVMNVDCPRIAAYLGIPYQWPRPDPVINTLDADGVYVRAEHQPHIHRLTHFGILAQERGKGIEFAEAISTLIWSVEDWDKGDHLTNAAKKLSLDLGEMDEIVRRESARFEAEVERNQATLKDAGHWGVPTCVFHGEPFYGQDRLDILLWRMKQHGLRERGA